MEKLVAFSCKRRGFCPACGARRIAEAAAHLVEQVIPHVPVRQWVVSFPIPLRHLFATQPQLLSPVLQVIHRALSTFVIKQAGLTRAQAHTGAVTLIQRFGSKGERIDMGSDMESLLDLILISHEVSSLMAQQFDFAFNRKLSSTACPRLL